MMYLVRCTIEASAAAAAAAAAAAEAVAVAAAAGVSTAWLVTRIGSRARLARVLSREVSSKKKASLSVVDCWRL
jgi:hypothetical protein